MNNASNLNVQIFTIEILSKNYDKRVSNKRAEYGKHEIGHI